MAMPKALTAAAAEEWEQALADAQLPTEKVRVWLADSPPGDAPPAAQYFYRYQPLEGHGLSTAQLEEAEACPDVHRVIVHPEFISAHDELDDDASIAALGGLMRHELEHARQVDALGSDFSDMDGSIVDHVLWRKAGRLPGGNVYYTLKPAEQDANAAAAMYLRQRHPGAVDAILGDPKVAQLARSNVGPESLDTLWKRTVCFLYLFRDTCRDWAASQHFSFADKLEPYSRSAAELWRVLEEAEVS